MSSYRKMGSVSLYPGWLVSFCAVLAPRHCSTIPAVLAWLFHYTGRSSCAAEPVQDLEVDNDLR